MAYIPLVITSAGLAEVVNAQQTGTGPVELAAVGLGTGKYTASEGQTALQAEFKRLNTIAGGATADNVIHVSIKDESVTAYTVYEIGVYTASGTLFAVYSQNTPIIEKAAASFMMVAFDVVLTNLDPDSVTIGDSTFVLNAATTTKHGIIEIATNAEVQAGTDTERAVTPAGLSARIATTSRTGLAELATNAEAIAGTDSSRVVTPAAMVAAFVKEHGESGMQKLPGGFIIQWGKAKIAPDGSTSIKFPATFPTRAVEAQAISEGAVQPSYSIASLTAGNVSFKHNANGGVTSRWFAIGQ